MPQYGAGWQCAGYKTKDKVFLAVWRLASDDDTLHIPIKAEKASILYELPNVAECILAESELTVIIKEKCNALLIELDTKNEKGSIN